MTDLPHFDAHCHPTHPASAPTYANSRLFAQSVTPAEWDEFGQQSSGEVVWGLGLHPLWLQSEDELEQFLARLSDTVAVGEIGLDYTEHAPLPHDAQRSILGRILSDSRVSERLVSLHALLAYQDVINMVREYETPGAIIHWYADADSLASAIEGDLFFSVNDAIFANRDQASVVARMPRNRILTETDAPYIQRTTGAVVYGSWLPFVDPSKPALVDDATRLMSGEVTLAERSLAVLWGVGERDVRRQVWTNLAELETRVAIRPFGATELLQSTES